MSKGFSIELLQAVNDWQRGSSSNSQRQRRAEALEIAAAVLPQKFRRSGLVCFRQIALKKGHLWKLLAEKSLVESVSSWTPSLEVAKAFKGGVPPEEWRGVILMVAPKQEQIVLNLATLYQTDAFLEAAETSKSQIKGFHDGIGKYRATQSEVVLKVDAVGSDAICTMGGYASNKAVLSRLLLGRDPTSAEQNWIDKCIAQSGAQPSGPWWLSPDGWQNVYARLRPKIEELKIRNAKT